MGVVRLLGDALDSARFAACSRPSAKCPACRAPVTDPVEVNVTDSDKPAPVERGASPSAVSITGIHGDWTSVNHRLARIEHGKVRCMHIDTGELVECSFSDKSGSWAEG